MTTEPINPTGNPVSNMPVEQATQNARPAQSSVTQFDQAGRDSVEISVPAHVKLLSQQGFSAGEIAFRLRLNIQTVNQYLEPDGLS